MSKISANRFFIYTFLRKMQILHNQVNESGKNAGKLLFCAALCLKMIVIYFIILHFFCRQDVLLFDFKKDGFVQCFVIQKC